MKFLAILVTIWLVLSEMGSAQQVDAAIQNGTQPGSPAGELGDSSNIKNIPELYAGETSDFGTQQLVQQKPVHKWIQLDLDWQISNTDNYLLTTLPNPLVSSPGGKLNTTQMVSTWNFAFAPDPVTLYGFKVTPKIGFRQSFFNYGIGTGQNSAFSAFDFDTQTIYGEARTDLGNGWSASGGADWTRITSSYADSEIYRQVGPRWGIGKQFKINDYNYVNIGLNQQYLFTEVPYQLSTNLTNNIYDRLNTVFSVNYVWSPVDRFLVIPFYRMTDSYYPQFAVPNTSTTQNEDRTDFVHTIGLNLSYQINDYITLRTFVSYEKRMSTYENPQGDPKDQYVPEYSKFDTGFGGAFTVRF